MAHPSGRRWIVPLLALLVLGQCYAQAMANTVTPRSRATADERSIDVGYTGTAWGTYAFVGNNVKSGKSAVSSLGCRSVAGTHHENTVTSVFSKDLLETGVIDTTADALAQGNTQTAKTTADVHDIVLLQGVITGSEITAVSATSHDDSGFSTSSEGSSVVDLDVNGQHFNGTVDPNTKIDLPGIGYVVLNEQSSFIGRRKAGLTVNMIHVVVTAGGGQFKKGTQVFVAHAESGLRTQIAGVLDGRAYGTRMNVDDKVVSGPSALVGLGCFGTGGRLRTNEVDSVSVPPAFDVGTVVDTAQGTVKKDAATGETTSEVQLVDVAQGVITADLVKADAHAFTDGTTFSFGDDGTQFVNLYVNGQPFGDNVPPNTMVDLPGLGTLWLRREIERKHSIEIRMIELIVTQDNPQGLPIGADIRVAVAEASAH